ncbi:hypothetical protein L3Q82_001185 [Scortum barcoo]|uniref:Uncharacterized protein n=1 Tax=Scortum barcoo TaxID=214431 RepID=A0ACB8W714_9TELE|nr:hypothetical protein L3Q82_001185 [Scortum barcoo]
MSNSTEVGVSAASPTSWTRTELCRSLQEHSGTEQQRQPYILAVGTARNSIPEYYIALDGELLPCKAKSSVSAFDELFKTH